MRTYLSLVALLAGGILGDNPARAGVYFASDRPLTTGSNQWMGYVLRELRAVPVAPQNGLPPDPESLRFVYARRQAALEPRRRDGSLGNLDRTDLGACYLRFRRFSEAVEVLEAGDKTHFLVLLNLATAFFEMGELGRALDYQEQALSNWPPVWAGWTPQEWAWLHRSERAFLTLIRHRQEEQRQGGGRAGPVRTIDPLFPRFRLPPADAYQAGPLPFVMEDLPPDALATVSQLMIGLPFDGRLTWLAAELLNVSGDVEGAYRLMDELVWVRDWSSVEQLRRHKQVLRRALESRRPLTPDLWTQLSWSLAPRGALVGSPGLGQAMPEAAWVAANYAARMPRDQGLAVPPPVNPSADTPDTDSIRDPLPKPRDVLIGFCTGALVSFLVVLQGRQWLGRRAPPPA